MMALSQTTTLEQPFPEKMGDTETQTQTQT